MHFGKTISTFGERELLSPRLLQPTSVALENWVYCTHPVYARVCVSRDQWILKIDAGSIANDLQGPFVADAYRSSRSHTHSLSLSAGCAGGREAEGVKG